MDPEFYSELARTIAFHQENRDLSNQKSTDFIGDLFSDDLVPIAEPQKPLETRARPKLKEFYAQRDALKKSQGQELSRDR